MRCSECGAVSRVTATQEQPFQFRTQRRRRCSNGHEFLTFEVHEGLTRALSRARLDAYVVSWRKNVERFERDKAMWAERAKGTKFEAIALEYGVSHTTAHRAITSMEKFLNAN